MTVKPGATGSKVVLLAPTGRDAAIAATMLHDAGLGDEVVNCADLPCFVAALNEDASFAVATDEALRGADLRPLAALVADQPAWSDLPFLILTARGGGTERNPAAARLAALLGHVVFIERPFHPTTFVSAARTARRGRLRQFEARGRMSALRAGEERLRQVNESLESRVLQRTVELREAHASVLVEISQRQSAEEQLRQAQKVEAIGQISGGVAHDFNNLLLAVLANLDLLRRRVTGDGEAQTLLEGAIEAAQRGAALTQRLLAFARQQALKVEPADLAALVRGMRGLIETSLVPGIELTLELADGLPPALIDHNQVELALLNLVVNARDAMPGGGRLQIALDVQRPPAGDELPPGDYLRLSVTDAGHGMDWATLRRAVDPFFSTKGPGKGTGLGLSMVDGLARQMHGALRLASEPGLGTRAELWVPGGEPAPAPAPAPVRLQAMPSRNRPAADPVRRRRGHHRHGDRGACWSIWATRSPKPRSGPQALTILETGTPVDSAHHRFLDAPDDRPAAGGAGAAAAPRPAGPARHRLHDDARGLVARPATHFQALHAEGAAGKDRGCPCGRR